MQALQSGGNLTIYPGRIVWTTPDCTTLGFTNRHAGVQLRNVGVLNDISLVQPMDVNEDLKLLFVMTEDLLEAQKQHPCRSTPRHRPRRPASRLRSLATDPNSQPPTASRYRPTRSSPSSTTGTTEPTDLRCQKPPCNDPSVAQTSEQPQNTITGSEKTTDSSAGSIRPTSPTNDTTHCNCQTCNPQSVCHCLLNESSPGVTAATEHPGFNTALQG